jgi:hypothetical protein
MVLTHAFPPQLSPKVAFNGSEFLVAWLDYRLGGSFESNVVFGARLTPSGQLIGSSGLLISRAASYKQALGIAANPSQFLVAWEDRRADNFTGDIYGCRVAGGTVRDTNGIAISTAAGHQTYAAVAADGTDFMVVWTSGGGIWGSRFAQNGTVVDPAGISIGFGDSPDVAFGGGNYFVVWQDGQPQPHIRGARVNNGIVLDSSGIPINTFNPTLQRYPKLAFNGAHFLVVWQDERNSSSTFSDIYSTLVDGVGNVLSTVGTNLTGAGFQRSPSVAAGGSDFLVIWHDYANSATAVDLAGGRVQAGTGAAIDGTGFPINGAPGDQFSFAVAYAGAGNYLVAYETRVHGVSRVMARFVSGPPPGNLIPGLFNTGVDSLRRPLPDDSPDPHYTIAAGPVTGTAYAATSGQGFPIPPWLGDNSISAWIGPTTDTWAAGGTSANYSYQTTFDLTGYDPATARIVGQWSTDNNGMDILINGQSTGQPNTAQFTSFSPFRINSGFINGVNTLTFVVNNADGPGDNPTGLRVEMEGSVGVLSSPVFHPIEWRKDTIVLTWEGRPGWSYIVQYTDDLTARRWNEFPDVIRPEGPIATFTDSFSERDPRRFYRVLLRR